MTRRTFTVDAELLRELGARLVGRPHIALSELIKNAYDADAMNVEIAFLGNSIRISDDGHGMSEETFIGQWMRIGTSRKVTDATSPALGRPLTGSKGVGRLSAQLLADTLELRSVALVDRSKLASSGPHDLEEQVHASINWPSEIDQNEDLTDVAVDFWKGESAALFANGSHHGTSIELGALNADWDASNFEDLAREIWTLQPPFELADIESRSFRVTLETPFDDVQESFNAQMIAIMDISAAKVTGLLLPPGDLGPDNVERIRLDHATKTVDEDGELDGDGLLRHDAPAASAERYLRIDVAVAEGQPEVYVVEIPNCQLHDFDFEIRIFDLHHRQRRGIKVDGARNYLNQFGGVHLYDSDFRLPYYGPEVDWLRLELDHARRISRSQLLPGHLQIRNAMHDLPSNKRVFGAVNISTSVEQRVAAASVDRRAYDALAIQITRDRLVDNQAFRQLTASVRLSVHLYALARAKTKIQRQIRPRGGVRPDSTETLKRADLVIESLQSSLPSQDYQTLRDSFDSLADDLTAQKKEARAYASLLGALATAGMTSLAYEHEVSKQRDGIEAAARALERISEDVSEPVRAALGTQIANLTRWGERSNRVRALFRPLLDEESRTAVSSFRAVSVIGEAVDALMVLARATIVDFTPIPEALRLPSGSYAAWTAIFQNLLINAFRATVESKPASIMIDGEASVGGGWIRIQDNGVGLSVSNSDRLFLPFERDVENGEKIESLGLGGSGLGLTIVRMIADELHCRVRFVEPDPGWSASIKIEWKN